MLRRLCNKRQTLFIHVRRCSLRWSFATAGSRIVSPLRFLGPWIFASKFNPSAVERMQQLQSMNSIMLIITIGSMDRSSTSSSSKIKRTIQIVGKLLNYVVLAANMNFEFTRCVKQPTTSSSAIQAVCVRMKWLRLRIHCWLAFMSIENGMQTECRVLMYATGTYRNASAQIELCARRKRY